MFKKYSALLIVFHFVFLSQTLAQEESPALKTYVGMNIGIGIFNEMLPEKITYQPILILGYYAMPLTKNDDKNIFTLYFEPQINPVLIDKKLKKFEFGVNVGICYSRKIFDNTYSYFSVSTGPHYINADTRLQAKGFIFSDNFAFGLKRQIHSGNNDYELNVQYRFRHISNAGLQSPNYGIDNHLVVFGMSKALDK